MATEAELRAKKKWKENHKELEKEYRYRSQARKFIRDYANEQDLREFTQLINEKKKKL